MRSEQQANPADQFTSRRLQGTLGPRQTSESIGLDAGRPERWQQGLYTITLIDIASSARHDARTQRRMRNDLYDLVSGVVEYCGATLASLPFSDVGDGLRVAVPLDRIQPTHVIDMFVLGLTAGLREHRRSSSEAYRLRMRVAFDFGLIEPHLGGWAGDPLVRVARLVNAEPLRRALDLNPDLDLVTFVSDTLYQTAIRHGYGYLEPTSFRPVRVQIKEFNAQAWLLTAHPMGRCGQCGSAAFLDPEGCDDAD